MDKTIDIEESPGTGQEKMETTKNIEINTQRTMKKTTKLILETKAELGCVYL